MRQLSSIQEKILDRTLYLIASEGSSNVSIRTIAKEAEVNVSAINYYFRTKDEMLKLVKDFYLDNTRAAYAPLMDESLNPEERLICREIRSPNETGRCGYHHRYDPLRLRPERESL